MEIDRGMVTYTLDAVCKDVYCGGWGLNGLESDVTHILNGSMNILSRTGVLDTYFLDMIAELAEEMKVKQTVGSYTMLMELIKGLERQ